MTTTVDSASEPAFEAAELSAALAPDRAGETDEPIIPPLAELTDESLSAPVVQPQIDEFVCTSCFLVHHHTRRASDVEKLCRDCA